MHHDHLRRNVDTVSFFFSNKLEEIIIFLSLYVHLDMAMIYLYELLLSSELIKNFEHCCLCAVYLMYP